MPSDNPKKIVGAYSGPGETPTSLPVVFSKGSYDVLVGAAMWGIRDKGAPPIPPSIEGDGNQT